MPSELNKFARLFADNDWNYPFENEFLFYTKDGFKDVIDEFQTYGDIKKFIDDKNGVMWYEPEE